MDYKMVIGVRTDLKLSKGKTAAQVAHAAVLCALKAKRHKKAVFSGWKKEGQKKVVVKIRSLQELYKVKETAKINGIVTELVRDSGLTEIPRGTVTCVGVGPALESEVDRITAKYSLM